VEKLTCEPYTIYVEHYGHTIAAAQHGLYVTNIVQFKLVVVNRLEHFLDEISLS